MNNERTEVEHLTIAVVCLNEENNIENTILDIKESLPLFPMKVSIIMVDDGSSDRTPEVMKRLCDEHDGLSYRSNGGNLGMGRRVLNLLNEVDPNSWFSSIPGDNEIVFASLLDYLPLRQDYDVILGYLRNPIIRTVTRRVASAAFTSVVKATYGFPFRYLNGPKLYRAHTYQGIDVLGSGYAFNAELLAKALLRNPSLRIGEAPFSARGRATGLTKAFHPSSIVRAMRDFQKGHRSVVQYRDEVIAKLPVRKPQ